MNLGYIGECANGRHSARAVVEPALFTAGIITQKVISTIYYRLVAVNHDIPALLRYFSSVKLCYTFKTLIK